MRVRNPRFEFRSEASKFYLRTCLYSHVFSTDGRLVYRPSSRWRRRMRRPFSKCLVSLESACSKLYFDTLHEWFKGKPKPWAALRRPKIARTLANSLWFPISSLQNDVFFFLPFSEQCRSQTRRPFSKSLVSLESAHYELYFGTLQWRFKQPQGAGEP